MIIITPFPGIARGGKEKNAPACSGGCVFFQVIYRVVQALYHQMVQRELVLRGKGFQSLDKFNGQTEGFRFGVGVALLYAKHGAPLLHSLCTMFCN